MPQHFTYHVRPWFSSDCEQGPVFAIVDFGKAAPRCGQRLMDDLSRATEPLFKTQRIKKDLAVLPHCI